MSHSEASGPHNPYRPSKRRQPEPLKEDKEGWEKMCGYVDKIASSWGYDNEYNDGLWTPSEWADAVSRKFESSGICAPSATTSVHFMVSQSDLEAFQAVVSQWPESARFVDFGRSVLEALIINLQQALRRAQRTDRLRLMAAGNQELVGKEPRVQDLGEFIKAPETLETLRPASPPRPRQAVPSHSQTSSHSTTKRPHPLNVSTTTRNKRPSITRSDSSSSGFGPQLSHHFASPVTPSHESPFFASPTSSIMDLPPVPPSYSALARRDSQSSQCSDPPQVRRESFASRRFTPQNGRSSFSSERSDDLNNSLSSLPEIPRSRTTGEFRIPEAPASFSSTRQSPYPFTQRQRTGSSSSTASSAPGQAQTSNPFVLYDSRVPPPPPLSTGFSAPSAPQAPSSPRLEFQAKAVLHRFIEAYGSDISADYNLQRLCAIVGGSNLTESEAQDVSNYCEMLTNADPLHLPLTLELPRNLFEIRDCARQNKVACHPLSFNFGQQ
ncbi:hypothetical protein JCM5350_004043 [Sporobolomyces pararoseus]